MKRVILFLILGCASCFALERRRPADPYVVIPIQEVYAGLLVRAAKDAVGSGQIKSEKGRAEFLRKYRLQARLANVDFRSQMLVYGVTDEISTRVLRFLRNQKTRGYCLDYYDAGIEYELKQIDPAEKYSYVEVFLVERIEGIRRVPVKNLLPNVVSKEYE